MQAANIGPMVSDLDSSQEVMGSKLHVTIRPKE